MNLSDFNELTCKEQFKPVIICNDGFEMSVQGSRGHYCFPKELTSTYSSMEVGYPTGLVPQFKEYQDGESSVFGYVPVSIIQNVIDIHGGININSTFKN